MDEIRQPADPAADQREEPAASQRTWRSEDLFGARREILILHGSDVYRLRRTRNGKLILQK